MDFNREIARRRREARIAQAEAEERAKDAAAERSILQAAGYDLAAIDLS